MKLKVDVKKYVRSCWKSLTQLTNAYLVSVPGRPLFTFFITQLPSLILTRTPAPNSLSLSLFLQLQIFEEFSESQTNTCMLLLDHFPSHLLSDLSHLQSFSYC